MKKLTVITLALALLLPALATIPRFQESVLVEDAGVTIDVGYYAAPQMFDWNGDGSKDLVLGQFGAGNIRFYPNVGDDSAPVFRGFEFMRAGGVNITLPSG